MSLPLENKKDDEEWRGSCVSRLKELGLLSLVKALRGHNSSLQVNQKFKSGRWWLVNTVEFSFHT